MTGSTFLMKGLAMRRRIGIALLTILLSSSPVFATGEVSLETFETRAIGAENFKIYNLGSDFDTLISGGSVVNRLGGDPGFGNHAYSGKSITIITEDPFNFSWPGVGAWVQGPDVIELAVYEYNESTGKNELRETTSLLADGPDEYLALGGPGYFITKAIFSSSRDFTIDNLTLGIPGIGPGIPEPSAWVMMICGLGLVGCAIRRRSAARACSGCR